MGIKNHLSPESYHKLNRSIAVSHGLHLYLYENTLSFPYRQCIPHFFSYIHDDICYVLDELKSKGLCDEWLRQAEERFKELSE